ncbi:MAG: hypothetical protein R2860_10820 [Desulfobacterales bacterium]
MSDGKWFVFRINYHHLPGKSTGMKAGAGGCHFAKKNASEGESLFFQVISGPAQRFNGEATAYQGYKNLNLFQCIIKLIEFVLPK